MDRRTFLGTLTGGLHAAPLTAEGQQTVVRVGFLASGSSRSAPLIGDFEERLRELGYVEGRNLTIEFRSADGIVDRLPTLAAEAGSALGPCDLHGDSSGGGQQFDRDG